MRFAPTMALSPIPTRQRISQEMAFMSIRMSRFVTTKCVILVLILQLSGCRTKDDAAVTPDCAFAWDDVQENVYSHTKNFFEPNRPTNLEVVCVTTSQDTAAVLFAPERDRGVVLVFTRNRKTQARLVVGTAFGTLTRGRKWQLY